MLPPLKNPKLLSVSCLVDHPSNCKHQNSVPLTPYQWHHQVTTLEPLNILQVSIFSVSTVMMELLTEVWCRWRQRENQVSGKVRRKVFQREERRAKGFRKQDRVNVVRQLSRKTRAYYFQETNLTWIKKSSACLDFHWEDDTKVYQECILEETI